MNGVIFLSDIQPQDAVGGKAAGLAELIRRGRRVPNGFVILQTAELETAELLSSFDQLGAEQVAVRSSALNEDGDNAAWAGQLETKLNVHREGLIEAIKQCRESAGSARAQAYGIAHGEESGGVAVIVQRMLASDISGVAFSKHPVTQQDAVVIETVYGLGEQLVGGTVTPDTYVIAEPFAISEQHLSGAEPILNTEQLGGVTMLTRDIAREFGFPIDIEWAYEDDMLYVLQARPITTL